MNAKLLPCPFCWSSASLETAVTANVGGEEIQYVTCVECSAQADPHDWQTRPEAPAPVQHVVPCPCTLIEQDETCPVGYPSLLCEDCDGKGVLSPSAAAVVAIFDDLRDRRFLKWLFDRRGDDCYIGDFTNGEKLKGLDLEVQAEIKAAWREIISKAHAPSPQPRASAE